MSRLICAASDLLDGGDGFRFLADTPSGPQAAFVLRWKGRAYAYLNQCAHVSIELDWNPGKFLEGEGAYVMCAAHGALYEPDSGLCVGGPCVGRSLRRLNICEHNGNIFLEAEA